LNAFDRNIAAVHRAAERAHRSRHGNFHVLRPEDFLGLSKAT
jgi:hypothetical protein